jgi:hypothetical protein
MQHLFGTYFYTHALKDVAIASPNVDPFDSETV